MDREKKYIRLESNGTHVPLTQISVVTCALSYNTLLWASAQLIITV